MYNKNNFDNILLSKGKVKRSMSLFDELKENGVDVDEGMERMMGNANLYQRMLGKLLNMIKETSIDTEFDGNDYEEIIEKVHSLKGAAGNLSITPLFKGYTEMLTLLREDKPEEARAVLKELLPVQDKIMACIEKNM